MLCSVFLALACVADTSLATTPIVPPTQARPTTAQTPNLTPVLPARPVAPAAGTYFGQINAVDVPGITLTFSAICLGADRTVLRELAATDKAPRVIPLLPTTAFSAFTSPPNNPAAGRVTTIDLSTLANLVQANPAAKWFITVNPQGVATVDQDSGVRPSPQPDDPCPHG